MIITNVTIHNHREDLQIARATGGAFGYVKPEIEKAGTKKTRIYVTAKDWNLMDDFLDRINTGGKQALELHRMIRKDGSLARLLASLDITGKARWSRYAGCSSCPCSPGFVIEDIDGVPGDKGREIWVTVSPSASQLMEVAQQS